MSRKLTLTITLEHNGPSVLDEIIGRQLDSYVEDGLAEEIREDIWDNRDLTANEQEDLGNSFNLTNIHTAIAEAVETSD